MLSPPSPPPPPPQKKKKENVMQNLNQQLLHPMQKMVLSQYGTRSVQVYTK